MKGLSMERLVLGCPLSITLAPAGPDWTACVTGGCGPHVGSVSVAYWDRGAVTLKTVLLPGHRDDVVGDRFATALAQRLQATVSVSCGIHYDGPGPAELREIVDGAQALLDLVLAALDGN